MTTYLVIGFIPEESNRLSGLQIPVLEDSGGVHTPLRQDGYYGSVESARGLAELWRENKVHPRECVAVVKVVDE